MQDSQQRQSGERLLLQVGAVAAVIGTVLQVAAGTISSSLPGGDGDAWLRALAEQSSWLLPVIYLGFVFGALLWVWALVALASALTSGAAWALGRLAAASVIVGATLHAIDGVLHGVALPSLIAAFAAAPEGERAALVQDLDLLQRLFEGTWAGVITLFHGAPFVLAGLAVALSRRYPAWLGWIGVIGGAGSLVVGVGMFLDAAPAGLAVPFAVVLSFFMVILGWLMWVEAGRGVTEPDGL